ncbi:MAG: tetratricopeptide repeat protein, partial [Candidatus Xenobia bacterium]
DEAEAERCYRRALQVGKRPMGAESTPIAEICERLAALYVRKGRVQLALPLYQRALASWENIYGLQQTDSRRCAEALIELYRMVGQATSADELEQRLLAELA